MTEELRGVVKAVIFKSKDESYCVFRIEEKGSGTSVTVTGNIVQGCHFGEDETGSGR